MFKKLMLAGVAAGVGVALTVAPAAAKDLNSIGVTVGSLGNPFFIAVGKGATDAAKAINPNVKITMASADYDLGKQSTQIDNFIASRVDMILVNASDPRAIGPAVKRAQAAGITVVAVDVAAEGANATVQTDNVQAGRIACQYMVEQIGGKGNVIIQNGPQVSSVIDRVNGCKQVLSQNSDVKLLSSDQDAKGSRDGGLNVMQGHLTRFPDIKGVFTINDPQAIGSDLAAKQLNRTGLVITSVDGAPDIVGALKGNTQVKASASQDPYTMGKMAVQIGYDIMNDKKPENPVVLMPSKLVTRDNVGEYQGWTR